jgi:hypothetical protein
MINYEKVRWDNVKNYANKVLMIDVDHPVGVTVLNNPDREALLKSSKYITHETNNYGPTGKVYVYNIVEKMIDNKNNLLLFVKSKVIHYDRD